MTGDMISTQNLYRTSLDVLRTGGITLDFIRVFMPLRILNYGKKNMTDCVQLQEKKF